MSANVVFINVDWKSSRMHTTLDKSVDFVNVHAPSGGKTLKDSQRRKLLTNLLQSNSQARPGCTIGQAHFVIGGDMNTDSHRMSNMLQECRHHGSLRTQAQIHEPASPKHGDLCIVAGIRACTLTTSAPNHDPQQALRNMLVRATEPRYRAAFASTERCVNLAGFSDSLGCFIGLERSASSSSRWVCYRATLANTSNTATYAAASHASVEVEKSGEES